MTTSPIFTLTREQLKELNDVLDWVKSFDLPITELRARRIPMAFVPPDAAAPAPEPTVHTNEVGACFGDIPNSLRMTADFFSKISPMIHPIIFDCPGLMLEAARTIDGLKLTINELRNEALLVRELADKIRRCSLKL